MSSYFQDINTASVQNIPWNKLSNSKILVAGATGLIGSCLVRLLLSRKNQDYEVYVLCRNISRAEELFAEFLGTGALQIIQFDIQYPINFEMDFDYIIDAASGATPAIYSTAPVSVILDNIYGVNHLLSYGIKHRMKRFLYISSGEIYGEGDGCVFSEDYSGHIDSMSARSCYPSSKRAAETLACAYAEQFGADIVVARPCHIYGPEFSPSDNRAYAEFFRNAVNGKDIVLKSSGSQYRSWCYVVDCASAIMYILLKGESKEAYNISDSSSCMTIRTLAEHISSCSGTRVIVNDTTTEGVPGGNPVLKSILSDTKIKTLGWSPLHSAEESIKNIYNYLKENDKQIFG